MSYRFHGLALAVLVCTSLSAQTTTGTLEGSVRDQAGALIPGAKVRVSNVRTGVTNDAESSGVGRYVVPFLLPGQYSIAVEKSGFRKYVQTGIKLDVQQVLSVDVELAVGDVTSTVTVEATPPPVETNTGTFSTLVENKMFMDLPLDGRNPYDLVLIAPGVTTGSRGPIISGGRTQANEYGVDGTSVSLSSNTVSYKEVAYTPNIDAVQEFSVQTNSLAAEYGRTAGGMINVATKSGGNQLHGSAFEFLRNSKMDANNFFSNRAGIKRGVFQRNQYGATAGGPMYLPHVYDGRNRTFFFFDFQGTNARTAGITTTTVPLPEWTRGDFTTLKAANGQPDLVYDPVTNRANPSGGYIRDPFPGNIIPANRIDAVVRASVAYFPAPNAAPANPAQANNFTAAGKNPSDAYTYGGRFDHNFSERWRMFGRVTVAPTKSGQFNVFGNPGTPTGSSNDIVNGGASVDQTVLLSPTTVVNFRLGFGRYRIFTDTVSHGFDQRQLGYPESIAKMADYQYPEFPRMDFTNLSTIGQSGPTHYSTYSYVFQPSLTKILSKHTIKAGMEARRSYFNVWQAASPAGYYIFQPGWTQQNPDVASATSGFSLASGLLGLPYSGQVSHDMAGAFKSQYYGMYLQDEFHLTSRLTVNIGLRYDIDVPKTERYNRLSYLDLSVPSPIAGKVPGYPNLVGQMKFATPDNPRQVGTDLNNVGPRFSFAYRAGSNTVIRGAYAIMYAESLLSGGGTTGGGGVEGFSSRTFMVVSVDSRRPTVERPLQTNPFPTWNPPLGPTPGPISGPNTDLGLTVQDSFFDATMNPRIQQWNLTVTRSLPGKVVAQIGYAGNRGMHLMSQESGQNYNQVPDQYLSLGTHLNDAVPNPFYGIITNSSSGAAGATVQRKWLLQAYPQYNWISTYRRAIGDNNFHSMIVRVDRRFSNGVGLLASFTAGKIIDNVSSGSYQGALQDFFNRRADRSVATEDVSRRLVLSFNAELPFGRGHRYPFRSRILEGLLGGWQTNGICSFQTGTPLAITQTLNNTGLNSTNQRPSNNGTSGKLEGGTRDERIRRWLNTSVFSLTPSFTWGTSSRTAPDIRAPGLMNLNLSLFKNVKFLENYTLQIRGEAFNTSNRVNLGIPNQQVNNSAFGIISGAGSARVMQMGLRLVF